jgi:hypothetical protein
VRRAAQERAGVGAEIPGGVRDPTLRSRDVELRLTAPTLGERGPDAQRARARLIHDLEDRALHSPPDRRLEALGERA